MKNFYIHTPFDCLIICNKEQTYLQAGQIIQFDVAQTLSIYPTENNKNNIAFILDLNHKEDDSRYLYVNFDNEEHFYLKNCIHHLMLLLMLLGTYEESDYYKDFLNPLLAITLVNLKLAKTI